MSRITIGDKFVLRGTKGPIYKAESEYKLCNERRICGWFSLFEGDTRMGVDVLETRATRVDDLPG